MHARRLRRLLAPAAVGGLLLTVLTTMAPPPVQGATPIPVEDAFVIDVPVDGGNAVARFEGAIHGAFRVPNATVVYWSLRESPGTQTGLRTVFEYEDIELIGGVLADPRSLEVLLPVHDEERCLCTIADDVGSDVDSTRFQTMYTTFPEIPAETTTLDIDVDGRGTIVAGVPVTGHPPNGTMVEAASTPMGTGWPAPPTPQQVQSAGAREKQDLVGRSSDTGGTVTTEGTGAGRLVRFDADILFAFDKSDLSPEAKKVLTRVTEELSKSTVQSFEIIGHTDGQGTADHNQTLSVERAQSVADVLKGTFADASLTVEGRGWNEPIATNDTDEGRAKNRRVTISYELKGEK